MYEQTIASANAALAEIPGLYGPVGIPELLVQKIWLRGDFRQDALQTADGRELKILRPGRWNRLGGPDFLGAEMELDGQRVLGDVEIHFYARDWILHQHERNPAFEGVVLHVVLFSGGTEAKVCRTLSGKELPLLHLSPLLNEGLEAYAMQVAILALEKTDPLELAAPLLEVPLHERRDLLRCAALIRWKQKCLYAAKRLAVAGSWSEACHQAMLEILGYSRNRGPMAELALHYPLAGWKDVAPAELDKRFQAKLWRLQGTRPANHPRHRLEQYARLVSAAPDWPERLLALLKREEPPGDERECTRAYRRRLKLKTLRAGILEDVWLNQAGSPRADTLLIDGCFPLAAIQLGKPALVTHWLHWWPGDLPDRLKLFLRTAGVMTTEWPLSNGSQQAALQCLIERER